MSPKAVIFDFDGLIVDTETPEVEVWQEIFREHGLEFPDAVWINAIGRGADQIQERPIDVLVRMSDVPVDPIAVLRDQHRRVMDRINMLPPRPGIVELIQLCKERRLPLAVASSSKHNWVDTHLERVALFNEFETVCCADDVQRAKPFPDLYLLACARLGVAPHEAIAIEDSPNGIAAARAAGVHVVCYPNSLTRHLDISAANLIVTDLHELVLP